MTTSTGKSLQDREAERVILVHQGARGRVLDTDFDELHGLALSAGAAVVGRISATRRIPDAGSFVGKGKAQEIAQRAKLAAADLVIIDQSITPIQERNLERITQCRVIDRTRLILDIFAIRARTHEGKMQVELAQLRHLSTRLVRGWTHLERQRGGIGLRGPGETQLETDRRLIGQRIRTIKKKLEKTHKQRQVNRYSRKKGEKKLISLVGYTNAGKTSLFNALTKNKLFNADMPFATLDSITRKSSNKDLSGLLFSDTVGFISDLPTNLIESFKSTLDELKQSDLLLHVIDVSDPDLKFKTKEVEKLLFNLGIGDIEIIEVFNKADLIENLPLGENSSNKVWVSAKTHLGLDKLAKKINFSFRKDFIKGWITLDKEDNGIREVLYSKGMVIEEGIDDLGLVQLHIEIQKDKFSELLGKKNIRITDKQEVLDRS